MAEDRAWFQEDAPEPASSGEDFWEGDRRRSRRHAVWVVFLIVVALAVAAVLWRMVQALS